MDYNKQRGIYGCYNEKNELVYIGSTALPLSQLEYNHRHWAELKYRDTFFRLSLVFRGDNWDFRWIQGPLPRTQRQIEIEEGALIRAVRPTYNKDMDPYESSIRRGDYKRL